MSIKNHGTLFKAIMVCLAVSVPVYSNAADITVCSSGCDFSDIDDAVNSISEADLFITSYVENNDIDLVNGSSTILGSNTKWNDGGSIPGQIEDGELSPGDLIQFGNDTIWYKITKINSNTSASIDRPYEGASAKTPSSKIATHERTRILIGTGLFNVCNLQMKPGIDIEGSGRDATLINAGADNGVIDRTCVSVFDNYGDNNVKNLTMAPTDPAFPHMDRLIQNTNRTIWAGTYSIFDNVHINVSNPASVHSGPNINWPIVRGGTVEFVNSQITYDNMGMISYNSRLPNGQNLIIKDSTITKVASPTTVLIPYAFVIGSLHATFNLNIDNVMFEQIDANVNNGINFSKYGTGFLTVPISMTGDHAFKGTVNVTINNSTFTGANTSTNDTHFRMFKIDEHGGKFSLYITNSNITSQGLNSKDIVNVDTKDDGSDTLIALWNTRVNQ